MSGPAGGDPGPDIPRVRVAVRIYRWALRLMPTDFRERHGREALSDFRTAATRASAGRGRLGVAKALASGLFDVVARAPGARLRARREAGVGAVAWVEIWLRDVALALRSLRRRPGFSAVATTTLALGIGANVAIFAVVKGVVLEPLPFPESQRVVSVRHHAPGLDLPDLGQSRGTVRFYRERARSLEALAVMKRLRLNGTLQGRPERVAVVRTRPTLGRAFSEDDARPGAPAVAVLSHRAWTSRFGGDPGVLGRTIRLEGEPVEVVGVMPSGFDFPDPEVVAFVPQHIPPDGDFGSFGLDGLARIADGVSLDEARTELRALQAGLAGYFPELTPDFLERARWSVTVEPYRNLVVGDAASGLWIVLGTVAVVLIIAAANVANLFLARAEGRRRELGVRAALGAGRGRLLSAFLSESAVLGALAGALGVVLAWVALRVLVAAEPSELPRLHAVELDGGVLLFAFGVSATASLILGALPALRYLAGSFSRLLRAGGGREADGPGRQRARNALVVFQLALALVLLIGSGLMLRTFQELRSVEVGVEPENVLTLRLSPGGAESPAGLVEFYRRAAEAVRALPPVVHAGITGVLPLQPVTMNGGSFHVEGRARGDDELPPVAWWGVGGYGVFEALGVPLLAGRLPRAADGRGDQRPVVWVNETFVRTHFDGPPLGERIRLGEEEDWREIVGVVGDVRLMELEEEVRPMVYLPLSPNQPMAAEMDVLALAVKTRSDPAAAAPAIREAVASVSPDVPLTAARTMDQVVAAAMSGTSLTMALLAIAAVMAPVLASVGIYGVVAYVVSRRTREFGVRMALGADAGDVRGMVLGQGLRVAVVGIALGLVVAAASTRLMSGVLFGVSPTDPATFLGLPPLLAAVAVLASYLPARRATRVDPSEALRAE